MWLHEVVIKRVIGLSQEDTDSDMSDAGGDAASVGGARRARHPHGMLRTMYRAALRAAATMSSTQCGPPEPLIL